MVILHFDYLCMHLHLNLYNCSELHMSFEFDYLIYLPPPFVKFISLFLDLIHPLVTIGEDFEILLKVARNMDSFITNFKIILELSGIRLI